MGVVTMSKVPFVDDDSNVSDAVSKATKTLVPWLPDPYTCDDCGVYCDAVRAYDPEQAAFYPNGEAPAWECPECEATYRRESY